MMLNPSCDRDLGEVALLQRGWSGQAQTDAKNQPVFDYCVSTQMCKSLSTGLKQTTAMGSLSKLGKDGLTTALLELNKRDTAK